MTTQAIAAVVYENHGEFTLESVELDDPRPDEILVRIEASGVCHTDAMAQGIMELPAVMGHEGMGVVEQVGSDVSHLKPGDRVIISFPWCGECGHCNGGRRYWCDNAYPMLFGGARGDGSKTIKLNGQPISSAFFQQSSFASHAITLARDAVKVSSDDGESPMLAALPCGIVTGAGGILNELKVGAKEGLAVFGAGAVGLSALMAANLAGAWPLICVDVVPSRLELALELGASHVINALEGDVVEQIKEISPSGIDCIFETSGNIHSFHAALAAVKTGGTVGAVTVPNYGSTFEFNGELMIGKGMHLTGVRMGSAVASDFIPKLLEFNAQGRFPYEQLVSKYEFSDINKAFADSHSGVAIKPVLTMT